MEDAVVIVNERVVSYINSLDRGNSDICNIIEKEAIEDPVSYTHLTLPTN